MYLEEKQAGPHDSAYGLAKRRQDISKGFCKFFGLAECRKNRGERKD
jgi:hypothetical protein